MPACSKNSGKGMGLTRDTQCEPAHIVVDVEVHHQVRPGLKELVVFGTVVITTALMVSI